MMKTPRLWAAAAIGAAIALSSCAYDPYYSSAGGYYGYGDGYGYGGSGFSTSLFVSTGDSRWGYDPYCHSYYDYRSRRYYDPYLYGYYPVGYRPPVVIGVPHPHGWNPGRGYCPPPRTIRNVTVVNYRNRESAYRNSNYSWARQVRVQPPSRGHSSGYDPHKSHKSNSSRYTTAPPSTGYSPGARPPSGFSTTPNRTTNPKHRNSSPDYLQKNPNRTPSYYNTPVTGPTYSQRGSTQRNSQSRNQPAPSSRSSSLGRSSDNQRSPQSSYPRGNGNNNKNGNSRDSSSSDDKRSQGPRHQR